MTHTNHVIKSAKLGKNVNVRVYGTKGYPIIAFPTQDQMADEWEANGMTDVFAPYVNDGRVQLFTVDSNDLESWSNPSDDYAARIARQEDYYDFVCDELLPFVHEANGSMLRPELTGASLGATQATICALRRPDLFQGVIALSGMYHTSYFFGNWGNALSYANDVNAFLPNTPADHPYIQMYRQRTFAFSIGQAADEQFGVSDLHFLQETFERLGINGWFDFWGPECNHDWYWWKQQMGKFLPEAVSELEGVAAAEPELCKPAAKKVQKAEQNVEVGEAAAKNVVDKTVAKAEENNAASVKAPQAAKAGAAKKEQVTKQVAVEAKASSAKAGATKQVAAKATPSVEKAMEPKTVSGTTSKAATTPRSTTAKHVAGTKAASAKAASTKAASAKSVSPAKKENAPEVKATAKVAVTAVKAEPAKEAPAKKPVPAKAASDKTPGTKASGSKAATSTKTTTTRSKSTSRTSTARRSNGNAKSTRARKSGKKSAK